MNFLQILLDFLKKMIEFLEDEKENFEENVENEFGKPGDALKKVLPVWREWWGEIGSKIKFQEKETDYEWTPIFLNNLIKNCKIPEGIEEEGQLRERVALILRFLNGSGNEKNPGEGNAHSVDAGKTLLPRAIRILGTENMHFPGLHIQKIDEKTMQDFLDKYRAKKDVKVYFSGGFKADWRIFQMLVSKFGQPAKEVIAKSTAMDRNFFECFDANGNDEINLWWIIPNKSLAEIFGGF